MFVDFEVIGLTRLGIKPKFTAPEANVPFSFSAVKRFIQLEISILGGITNTNQQKSLNDNFS